MSTSIIIGVDSPSKISDTSEHEHYNHIAIESLTLVIGWLDTPSTTKAVAARMIECLAHIMDRAADEEGRATAARMQP